MRLTPSRRPLLPRVLLGLLAAFVLIQLVPYGRAHTNPPVTATPPWSDPDTKALFTRACANCHSHATVWPWYSHVAPVSWLVQRHVDEGRGKFDINVPGYGRKADEAAEEVRTGRMPDRTYVPLHPEARLSAAERAQLADGLELTFGTGKSSGD
ncbi:mono/diheme cytochrome c family protein [Deinococcus metalli]|uniref:Cytochrome c n=1 Tax=Deinococcus metalli TaxID=1141878 RepID=A0A7W8KCQ0_9DEIO|nr:heme-binding domain-containing protein [Deinococcus metalli]MBB5374633.1 mono/diheme cytochrome c family protein [Deinococcus metalli]GHF34860.1 cytochrome c [Deinococcus metalli]